MTDRELLEDLSARLDRIEALLRGDADARILELEAIISRFRSSRNRAAVNYRERKARHITPASE